MSKIMFDPELPEDRFDFEGEPLTEEDVENEGKSKGLTPDQKRIHWEAYAKKTERQEEMFNRVIGNVFEGQENQIIQSLESTGKLPEKLDDDLTAKKFSAPIELVYESAFEDAV